MERGKLVVFEGAEGAGKSTQLRILASRLSSAGIPVVPLREPGGTVVGDSIRAILLDPKSEISPSAEALLFMASRAELVRNEDRMIASSNRRSISTSASNGHSSNLSRLNGSSFILNAGQSPRWTAEAR